MSPAERRCCAPLRIGAREVWSGDRLLRIGDAVVDALFEDEPTDSRRALRQRCFRFRRALPQEVTDLRGDPLPADVNHGERVVCLDPTLVSSDVHEVLELFECAPNLRPEAAIEAYEAASSMRLRSFAARPH